MKHFFLDTYFGGALIIVIGLLIGFLTIRYGKIEDNKDSVLQPFLSGIAAAIGSIALGIIIIYLKLKKGCS